MRTSTISPKYSPQKVVHLWMSTQWTLIAPHPCARLGSKTTSRPNRFAGRFASMTDRTGTRATSIKPALRGTALSQSRDTWQTQSKGSRTLRVSAVWLQEDSIRKGRRTQASWMKSYAWFRPKSHVYSAWLPKEHPLPKLVRSSKPPCPNSLPIL